MTEAPIHHWISAIGADRPGIVAALTRAVADAGGNIEDASMSRFRSWFSVMLLAAFPRNADPETALAPVADRWELALDVRTVKAAATDADDGEASPTHRVSVYGTDRPSIVATVAEQLHEAGANVLALEVDVARDPADSTADPLFVMVMDVEMAPDSATGEIVETLRARLGLDVHIVPLDGVIL